jgi:hypothetical protein
MFGRGWDGVMTVVTMMTAVRGPWCARVQVEVFGSPEVRTGVVVRTMAINRYLRYLESRELAIFRHKWGKAVAVVSGWRLLSMGPLLGPLLSSRRNIRCFLFFPC